MAVIRIDNGTTKIGDINYYYDYTDNEGEHRVFFTSETVPKLGDTIDTTNGVLVPRNIVAAINNPLSPSWPEPIINNDPGFQAKRKIEGVWPHGTVDFE